MLDKKQCVAMLLAGGQGSRLGILTANMAKPAIPYGRNHRIIDFPLSNCTNSGVDVVGVLTQPDLYEKMVSNLVEAKSRGAYIMGLTTYGNYSIEDTANFTVYVPKTDPHFATSLSVVPLQLLAYYVSCAKGLDVDKPRNLAKSVTVE